jgi:hypothetical protein
LRANDPRVLADDSVSELINYITDYSEAECTERSATAAAEYVESSKTLQVLALSVSCYHYSHEVREMTSFVLRSISHNTSLTKRIINTHVIIFASVAFEDTLTRTGFESQGIDS